MRSLEAEQHTCMTHVTFNCSWIGEETLRACYDTYPVQSKIATEEDNMCVFSDPSTSNVANTARDPWRLVRQNVYT